MSTTNNLYKLALLPVIVDLVIADHLHSCYLTICSPFSDLMTRICCSFWSVVAHCYSSCTLSSRRSSNSTHGLCQSWYFFTEVSIYYLRDNYHVHLPSVTYYIFRDASKYIYIWLWIIDFYIDLWVYQGSKPRKSEFCSRYLSVIQLRNSLIQI